MLTLPLQKAKTVATLITKYEKSKVLAWTEFSTYEFDSAATAMEYAFYISNTSIAGEMVKGKAIVETFKVFTIKESELYGIVFNWVVI